VNTIALETSIQPGSIALLCDDVTVYSSVFTQNRRTTQSFATQLEEGLKAVGWKPDDVDLFAICQGPGSFTGLRIGVTAGKTFAYATNCQLLALDTLDVIAARAPIDSCERLHVVMDAQRKQLYAAEFNREVERFVRNSSTRIVDREPWLSSLTPNAGVTGPGLDAWYESSPDRPVAIDRQYWNPTAEVVGRLAMSRFESGERQDYWKITPAYFRESAAEEKLKQRQQKDAT
jgi:tRNA threonylcarbamoyl adenosine modification protein YeaZ